jgi:hypothetical protein
MQGKNEESTLTMLKSIAEFEAVSASGKTAAVSSGAVFPLSDLSGLREELMQTGLDSWQSAELISTFLSGRGYGVSGQAARNVVSRIAATGCSLDCMQDELKKLAMAM